MAITLDRGGFTLSLDFELVFGSRDLVSDPAGLVAASLRTREAVFEPLVEMFTAHGLVATWATVGHLFLDGARRQGGRLHPDLPAPTHTWMRPGWFDGIPEGTEASQPAWYARSLVERLRDAGQEVGSHSFSHPDFSDPGCPRAVADADLGRAVAEAAALGIRPRSFVFPRNRPGHVDLLVRHGFTCWRGPEVDWHTDGRLPGPARRLGHLLDVVRGSPPRTVLPERDAHGLWVIPASAVFLPIDGVRRAVPVRQRVARSVAGLERAARDGRVFHLYIHPINFATDTGRMLRGLGAVLDHAARLRDQGRLDFYSMGQLAERATALTSPGAAAPSARSSG